MSKSIYLAGPISGKSYGEATEWRKQAALYLMDDIVPLSPMRGKEYLAGNPDIKGDYDAGREPGIFSTPAAIVARDRFDTMVRCDAVLFYLLGADKVSIGTMIEIGWADASRKPIILVIEKEGNIHDHAMVRQVAGFRTDDLREGCMVANGLLSDQFARERQ